MNEYPYELFGQRCQLARTTYSNNNRLALLVRFEEDISGYDDIVVSVNLVDEPCSEHNAYIDTNNCPWAEKFLLDNHIGEPVGIGFSGFCIYPCYKIDLSKVVRC